MGEQEINKGGRPWAFDTAEQLQAAVDEYFYKDKHDPTNCGDAWDHGVFRPTVSGLARSLGVDRRTVSNYAKNEDFSHIIIEARSRIEETLERSLYGNAVTGCIFNLKNNFGWKDKNEVEYTSKVTDDDTEQF